MKTPRIDPASPWVGIVKMVIVFTFITVFSAVTATEFNETEYRMLTYSALGLLGLEAGSQAVYKRN